MKLSDLSSRPLASHTPPFTPYLPSHGDFPLHPSSLHTSPPFTHLPSHAQVKLFDFSSRARCLAPFRVLSTGSGGRPLCLDLEVCRCLRDAQSRYLATEVRCQQAAVDAAAAKQAETEAAVRAATEALAAVKEAVSSAPSVHARQSAQAQLAESEALLSRHARQLPKLEAEGAAARAKLGLKAEAEATWRKACESASGASNFCPVFPIGDALLEPFWPQGLGSNRGFHSALDAAWAMYEMHREGNIEKALVERAFTYDVMLHTAFQRGGVLSGGGWTADSMTRYHPTVIKGALLTYEDPQSKRSHKGRAAVPPRYLSLVGASLAVLGGTVPNHR